MTAGGFYSPFQALAGRLLGEILSKTLAFGQSGGFFVLKILCSGGFSPVIGSRAGFRSDRRPAGGDGSAFWRVPFPYAQKLEDRTPLHRRNPAHQTTGATAAPGRGEGAHGAATEGRTEERSDDGRTTADPARES